MATDTTPTIRERREAIVREHVEAENRHDGEATIATFDHPRYEIIATGEIFDGASEVQSFYDENYGAFPDFTVTIEHTPGSTGPRNSCCFSSSEVILYQVCQMVSHRRAETTPKGSYPAMPFRVSSASEGVSAFGCETSRAPCTRSHPMAGDIRGRAALLLWLGQLAGMGFWLTELDVFGNDLHVCALSTMGARRQGVDVQTRVVSIFDYSDGLQLVRWIYPDDAAAWDGIFTD